MQNMRAFKTVCPLRNELHLDITTAVKVTMEACAEKKATGAVLLRGASHLASRQYWIVVMSVNNAEYATGHLQLAILICVIISTERNSRVVRGLNCKI